MNGFDDGWFLPYVIFQQQFQAHAIQSCTVAETHIKVNAVLYITTASRDYWLLKLIDINSS
jgi:hypothetical protein